MDEPLAIRRKRLRFRAWHRGTKESDIVMGGFADANLESFGAAELDEFEALLELPDADVMDWVLGKAPVPPQADGPVVRRLLRHEVRF